MKASRIKSWTPDSVNWLLLEFFKGIGFEDVKLLNLSFSMLDDSYDKKFTTYPEEIQYLTNLECFIFDNQEADIPNSLSKLQKLRLLKTTSEIPLSIRDMPNLKIVVLESSMICNETFPEGLIGSAVEQLNVSFNFLKEVPIQLSYMPNLKILNIYGNEIRELPIWFLNLKNIKMISLDSDRISNIPSVIRRKMQKYQRSKPWKKWRFIYDQ